MIAFAFVMFLAIMFVLLAGFLFPLLVLRAYLEKKNNGKL